MAKIAARFRLHINCKLAINKKPNHLAIKQLG